MAGREAAVLDELEDRLLQAQKASGIADGGAIFSGFCGYFFLGQVKFAHHALEGAGLFDGV